MALLPGSSAIGSPTAALGVSNSHPLQSITGTNMLVLERQRAALQPLLKTPVQILGQTDLAIGNLKFSGNAQRRLKKCLIFHGTFLLDFDISLTGRTLPMPSKQPRYRRDRSHSDFLINLNVEPHDVKAVLRKVWQADTPLAGVPAEKIRVLADGKYSTAGWNLKF